VRCGESALLVGFPDSQATVFALQPEGGNKKAGVPEASPVGAASRREGRFSVATGVGLIQFTFLQAFIIFSKILL